MAISGVSAETRPVTAEAKPADNSALSLNLKNGDVSSMKTSNNIDLNGTQGIFVEPKMNTENNNFASLFNTGAGQTISSIA